MRFEQIELKVSVDAMAELLIILQQSAEMGRDFQAESDGRSLLPFHLGAIVTRRKSIFQFVWIIDSHLEQPALAVGIIR